MAIEEVQQQKLNIMSLLIIMACGRMKNKSVKYYFMPKARALRVWPERREI